MQEHHCPFKASLQLFKTRHTWFKSVFQVGHQVVLVENQGPVQVGDAQIGQCAQTLNHKLLRLLLVNVSCQVTDVVLQKYIKYIQRHFRILKQITLKLKTISPRDN